MRPGQVERHSHDYRRHGTTDLFAALNVKTGSVTRGWIGVEVQEITPAVAESFRLGSTRGALIAGVLRGGPADKAGVKPGDVMVEIDGKPVADPAAMHKEL